MASLTKWARLLSYLINDAPRLHPVSIAAELPDIRILKGVPSNRSAVSVTLRAIPAIPSVVMAVQRYPPRPMSQLASVFATTPAVTGPRGVLIASFLSARHIHHVRQRLSSHPHPLKEVTRRPLGCCRALPQRRRVYPRHTPRLWSGCDTPTKAGTLTTMSKQRRQPKGSRQGGQFAPTARPADCYTGDLDSSDPAPEAVITGSTYRRRVAVRWEQHGGAWSAVRTWDTTPIGLQMALAQTDANPQSAMSPDSQPSHLFQTLSAVVWSEVLTEWMNSGDLAPEDAPILVQTLTGSPRAETSNIHDRTLLLARRAAQLSLCELSSRAEAGEDIPLMGTLRELITASGPNWLDAAPHTEPHLLGRIVMVADRPRSAWHQMRQELLDACHDSAPPGEPPSYDSIAAGIGVDRCGGHPTLARIYDRYAAISDSADTTMRLANYPRTADPDRSWAAPVIISESHRQDADVEGLTYWLLSRGPTGLQENDWQVLLESAAGWRASSPTRGHAAASAAAAWHARQGGDFNARVAAERGINTWRNKRGRQGDGPTRRLDRLAVLLSTTNDSGDDTLAGHITRTQAPHSSPS